VLCFAAWLMLNTNDSTVVNVSGFYSVLISGCCATSLVIMKCDHMLQQISCRKLGTKILYFTLKCRISSPGTRKQRNDGTIGIQIGHRTCQIGYRTKQTCALIPKANNHVGLNSHECISEMFWVSLILL
jgi:hypothetical protein